MKPLLIGILRGFTMEQIGNIVPAAIRGGLENLEITMNSKGAQEQIREAKSLSRGTMKIGAGTVLSIKQLGQALEAGAEFIVTPTLQTEVIKRCVRDSIPVFPGAFSPTEILTAWDLGATMVKIFPADTLGPRYVRALKAPLPHVKLLPTGGVDLETMALFSRAGADGFGVGSPIFDHGRINAAEWTWLEHRCRSFSQACAAPNLCG